MSKRYGTWAGNPEGRREDPKRCLKEICSGQLGDHGHQCCNKRGPSGYCRMHDPEALAKRKAKIDVRQAKHDLDNSICYQHRIIVSVARNFFKQQATLEDLEVAVAKLEALIEKKGGL